MGHPFNLAPGRTLNVTAESTFPGSLEVVEEDKLTAVYGWNMCSLKAYDDEELVVDLFELPDFGPGPGPRQVVEILFGGPGGPK